MHHAIMDDIMPDSEGRYSFSNPEFGPVEDQLTEQLAVNAIPDSRLWRLLLAS